MKNGIMVVIAVIAIAAIVAFMVAIGDFETSLQDAIDKSTGSIDTEVVTTEACQHIKNSNCICTVCGEEVHSFTDYIDCAPGSTYYCIICGEHSNIPVSHFGDNNGDGVCDSCGWEI